MLRPDLVLFLVVEEVTPGTIGAVPGIPEFLAPLGLIFALFTNITHFLKMENLGMMMHKDIRTNFLTSFP